MKISSLLIGLIAIVGAASASCPAEQITVDGTCMKCDEVAAKVRGARRELLDSSNKGCTSDDDCGIGFLESECEGSCAEPILLSKRFRAMGDLNKINAKFCVESNFRKHCPYATPGCVITEAYCDTTKGVCALKNVSPFTTGSVGDIRT